MLYIYTMAMSGCIEEGSRTSLFGSSTSVAVFSPISARRTTVEQADGYAGGKEDGDPGVHFTI